MRPKKVSGELREQMDLLYRLGVPAKIIATEYPGLSIETITRVGREESKDQFYLAQEAYGSFDEKGRKLIDEHVFEKYAHKITRSNKFPVAGELFFLRLVNPIAYNESISKEIVMSYTHKLHDTALAQLSEGINSGKRYKTIDEAVSAFEPAEKEVELSNNSVLKNIKNEADKYLDILKEFPVSKRYNTVNGADLIKEFCGIGCEQKNYDQLSKKYNIAYLQIHDYVSTLLRGLRHYFSEKLI